MMDKDPELKAAVQYCGASAAALIGAGIAYGMYADPIDTIATLRGIGILSGAMLALAAVCWTWLTGLERFIKRAKK